MLRRLLNIASIVCLVLCVALMGMWVRSYRYLDAVAYKHPPRLAVWLVCSNGQLRCEIERLPGNVSILGGDGDKCYVFDRPVALDPERGNGSGLLGFRLLGGRLLPIPVIPHWCAITVFGALGIALGRGQFHFSLRTLLITTTFVAVVLGMIAWWDRAWIRK
jgi:hypothetical protein